MKSLFPAKELRLLGRIAFLSLLLLPFESAAQNPRGTLRGNVEDASGGRIPSVKIVVQASGSTFQREAVSDDRGEFRIDNLVPGTYHVVATANGFAEAKSDVKVVISSVQEVTVTLKPQAVQQIVSVQGQASSITTPSNRDYQAGFGHYSPRGAQLRKYRLPGARDRARRAFRSHKSAHNCRLHRWELRLEQ
jgi:hypothetical protein